MSGEVFDVRLKAPFTAVMAGPTGSGKTHTLLGLVKKAMTEDMTTQKPVEIIYCYGAWQPAFEDIDHIRFHEGVIKASDIPNDGQHRWLIIDDLMEEAMGKHETNSLFTKTSHHSNISVFFLLQSLFKKEARTISLNTHYFFLFKNPRDRLSITNFARQAFPGKTDFIRESFEDATTKPHSFLLLDLRQETDERLRVIGNFASSTSPMIVYTAK